jgi:hypothetical protein
VLAQKSSTVGEPGNGCGIENTVLLELKESCGRLGLLIHWNERNGISIAHVCLYSLRRINSYSRKFAT